MKDENKSTGDVTTTSEVELQPKRRDRKASRNSWVEIYGETISLRKHKRLLGQKIEIDDGLEWRIQKNLFLT